MATERELMMTSEDPPQQVFDALLHHVQNGSYWIQGVSNESRQIAFGKKAGLKAIDGRVYMTSVEGIDSGSQVHLVLDNTGPNGLLSGWMNGRVGAKMLAEISTMLESGPSPAPEPVESYLELDDGTKVPWTSGELADVAEAAGS